MQLIGRRDGMEMEPGKTRGTLFNVFDNRNFNRNN